MKFCLVNLGCKVNRVESDSLIATFLGLGHACVSVRDADYIVVNTCTVTGEAEKKTRKAVRRALRENATASVFVTGCAAALDAQTFEAFDARVVVEPDKRYLVETIIQCFGGGANMPVVPAGPEGAYAQRVGKEFPTRVGIKIQDGCDEVCSYCIVPAARGKARSVSAHEIETEVLACEAAGVKELVLTGINLGSYCFEGMNFTALLKRLLEASEHLRFRISSIEPCDVDKGLIDLLATSQGRVCRHLHLPLQSGSTKVLGEMNRPYDAQAFLEKVAILYERVPTLALSTDVIVGFPGESEADFEQTLALVEHSRFSKVHVFPYSKRAHTPAAKRSDQVDPIVKNERVARLSALADALRSADYERRRGTSEAVLVETKGQGMSESYHRIKVPADAIPGSLITLTLP
ncbi:MAG: tRNA (N(6)-L-threonylcarbamoyladenosine(37)-C(2))-methylthiotransferase MtaB [Eggerthellaceae bacterium]|nr:tRNA (N(6)-L-threonylcarbamoyladenosine(37)-C(2))-methylthiotransferase MtaB [Eggerthellaceae bacterium]